MTLITKSRMRAMLTILVAVAALAPITARAQVPATWDHYKVYVASTPAPPPPFPVLITDQFTPTAVQHFVNPLQMWMNPVEKTVLSTHQTFPISDPITHYSWWPISPQPFAATVTATNQFGDQTLNVHDGVFLLNPALKNEQGPPPARNHYKCYLCDGATISVPLQLVDQFDTWQTNLLIPRFFCNPAMKQDPTGTYPIVDPNQHYICYEFQPYDPGQFSATFSDQFVPNAPIFMGPAQWICVPTIKQSVVGTNKNTWGKLKMLYR
ncbi:MAG: hypothetical protein HYR74_00740 [Candidatus Eisenbacteria bacterium]|nr:hypothetical protein [Candidatus Eisenbacteria bacterium]